MSSLFLFHYVNFVASWQYQYCYKFFLKPLYNTYTQLSSICEMVKLKQEVDLINNSKYL